MHRRLKVTALVLVAFAVPALPFILGVFTPLTPPDPPTWPQVHIGMQRSNILQLVGASRTGMYPEKPIDEWSLDGALRRRGPFVYGA